MGILTDGSYEIPSGLIFSFPVVCAEGDYRIFKGFSLSNFSRVMLNKTMNELVMEKDAVENLLPKKTIENLAKVTHPVFDG